MYEELLADLASGDDVRAERSVDEVARLGEDILPRLLELAHSADEDVRWWAVRALAASPHARAADWIPFLSDASPAVRSVVALALAEHPHESAVLPLTAALRDQDNLTAGLAGTALEKIGSPSVAALLEVMNDPRMEMRVRCLAMRALAGIRDHRAIPVMMNALSEESAVLQYWAQEGLERLGLNMVYGKP